MTTPPFPHDATLERLEHDLADLGRRVEHIRADLAGLRSAPPRWAPPPAWSPPPPTAVSDQPAVSPTDGTRAGLGARLLAVTGGAVTLLGVVLLLVLAARSGWFSPGARVLGGVVVGLALAGAGVRVHRRDRTDGAVALVGTGIAALYLDVAAASVLYGYLPPPVALAAAAVVLAAGLVLADRWRHEGLALGVLIGGGALAPVAAGAVTPLVVALLVVAQVAVVPVVRRRGWPRVLVTGTALATLAALADVLDVTDMTGGAVTGALAAVAVLAVAAASAVVTQDRVPDRARVVVVATALPAVLLAATLFTRYPSAALAGGVALALLGLAWARRGSDPVLAQVAAAAGAVAGFVATERALGGTAEAAVLLGQAAVLAVVALRAGRRGPLVAAGAYGLVGLAIALDGALAPATLTSFPSPAVPGDGAPVTAALLGTVVVAVLLTAAAVAALAALARLDLLTDRRTTLVAVAGLGLVALYGATGTVLGLTLAVWPTHGGFLTGHVLVTVSWTALALVLLARGLREPTARVLGGVLVAAAVAKLVLFDLTALDGLARVAAFLGAGVVLLVAGTRYARLLATSDSGTAAVADPTAAVTAAASSSRVGPGGTVGRHPEA